MLIFIFPLLDNNTVYGFGDNSEGQLGLPVIDVLNSCVPIRVTQFNDKIIQISAGSYHTAVLLGYNFMQQSLYNIMYVSYTVLIFVSPLENGDVYVWGSNNERQLGLDTINDSANIGIPTIVPIDYPVVYISCGHSHTAFVTSRLSHANAQYTTWVRSNLT